MENFADINVLTNILPSLQNLTPNEIMDKLNAYRSTNKAQISKLDKKLYIGTVQLTFRKPPPVDFGTTTAGLDQLGTGENEYKPGGVRRFGNRCLDITRWSFLICGVQEQRGK